MCTIQLGQELVATRMEDLLNCYEYRSFWVGWLDGELRVGRGHVYGLHVILHYATPIPHIIDHVSLHSAETEASWRFESDASECSQREPNDRCYVYSISHSALLLKPLLKTDILLLTSFSSVLPFDFLVSSGHDSHAHSACQLQQMAPSTIRSWVLVLFWTPRKCRTIDAKH